MTILPIMVRELRVAARSRFTYVLRMLGVAVVTFSIGVLGLSLGLGTGMGGRLFSFIHQALFCAIWILVPFMTADCLSRERREGTLGLLFLTPLRASGIVVAKGFAHGLRATSLGLAVGPVVTICFLLGGVSWRELALSGLMNFSALCLALAAGLVASSLSRRMTTAMALAGALSVLFCFGLSVGHLLGAVVAIGSAFPDEPLSFLLDLDGCWSEPGLLSRRLFWYSGSVTLCALLFLLGTVAFAARRLRQVWHEEPPPAWLVSLEAKFCQPRFLRNLFKRWMQHTLSTNPIGWLEQRRWSARMITWGWLGVVTVFVSFALTEPDSVSNRAYHFLAWLLVVALTLSAAASFRRERETGVLELLLVSPLRTSDIIWGRLRGLWIQLLPAMAMLLGIWYYLAHLRYGSFYFDSSYGEAQTSSLQVCSCASSFFLAPIIGLYFSLRCRNFLVAYSTSLLVGLAVPWAVPALLLWLGEWFVYGGLVALSEVLASRLVLTTQFLLECLLGAVFWGLLWHRLETRAFPLERTGGS